MGALNRAILLGCDNYFIPVVPDMFSLRGMQNIGRAFASWIINFQNSLIRAKIMEFDCIMGVPKFQVMYYNSLINIEKKKRRLSKIGAIKSLKL